MKPKTSGSSQRGFQEILKGSLHKVSCDSGIRRNLNVLVRTILLLTVEMLLLVLINLSPIFSFPTSWSSISWSPNSLSPS